MNIKAFKASVFFVLIMLVSSWLFYSTLKQTILNYRLKTENSQIKGYVIERYKVGGKGTIQIDYSFRINDKNYVGSETNDKYKVGDSLIILFLKKDPSINKSYTFIYQ